MFEFHVAEEEASTDDFPDGGDLVLAETHDSHGLHRVIKLFPVVLTGYREVSTAKECVVFGVLQDVFFCK